MLRKFLLQHSDTEETGYIMLIIHMLLKSCKFFTILVTENADIFSTSF